MKDDGSVVTGDARWYLCHFWNVLSDNLLDVRALCPGAKLSRVFVHALRWVSITLFANGRSWWETVRTFVHAVGVNDFFTSCARELLPTMCWAKHEHRN